MAIPIARGKVHARVDTRRILTQCLFDKTLIGHKLAPIVDSQKPQTGNTVAHRHLISSLGLDFGQDQLFGRLSLIGQSLFQPAAGKRKIRVLSLQVTSQLGQKRTGQRRIFASHIGQYENQIGRLLFDRANHPFRPVTGVIAIAASLRNPHGHTPQILNQCEPQHQWHGPQLAQFQRHDRLVCGQEPRQICGIQSTVGMSNQLQSDVVDARIGCTRASCQPGKLATVRSRQQLPSGSDLFFNQIKIVEQPFRCWCDSSIAGRCGCDQVVCIDQDALIFRQPRQEFVFCLTSRQPMRRRDGARMSFQLIDVQQFGPERKLLDKRHGPSASAGTLPPTHDSAEATRKFR